MLTAGGVTEALVARAIVFGVINLNDLSLFLNDPSAFIRWVTIFNPLGTRV